MKHDLNIMVPVVEAQNDAILNYMMGGKQITPIEARSLCNCERLAARIYDLRQYGWNIRTHKVNKNGKCFASYELEDTARAS